MPELGTTTDPTALIPGSPSELQGDVTMLRDYSRSADSVGQELGNVRIDSWVGVAGDAFRDFFSQVPLNWLRTSDVLDTAARALDDYGGVLNWAQGEAARAIGLWEQGEQATQQARESYDSALAQARAQAAQGVDVPPVPPFTDPGDELRQQARHVLTQARTQLAEAGDSAAQQIAGNGAQGDGSGWLTGVGQFLTGVWGDPELTTSGKADVEGPNAGSTATAPSWSELSLGSVKAHANLFEASAQGKLSYGVAELSGKAGVTVGAQAHASAGISGKTFTAKAGASAGVRASARGKASVGILDVEGKATAFGGAEAGVQGDIGVTGVNASASAFAGAKAGGTVGADVGGIGVGLHAEGWAGAGAEAGVDLGMESGKFVIGAHAGLGLGLGGSLGFEITVNPQEVVETVGNAADAVGEFADTAVDAAGDAADATVDALGSAASEVGDAVTFWN